MIIVIRNKHTRMLTPQVPCLINTHAYVMSTGVLLTKHTRTLSPKVSRLIKLQHVVFGNIYTDKHHHVNKDSPAIEWFLIDKSTEAIHQIQARGVWCVWDFHSVNAYKICINILIYLLACLSTSVCLSVCPSVRPPVCPSVRPSACLSVCLYTEMEISATFTLS